MQVDYNFGRILDALDEAGVADDTIVILTGDDAAGNAYGGFPGEGGSNRPWRGGLSTGYEGGMRTPGMMRWSGKIPSDRVTDEIVSDLDWFSTIAHLVGEEKRIPDDRPYDGTNQADFILGRQENSNREHIVTCVGNGVFAVKWRTLKVHFFTAEGTFSPIVEHTFPQVYDIKNDPGETHELWAAEGYSHLWVMKPVTVILTELAVSMQKYPNIRPGLEFEGYD